MREEQQNRAGRLKVAVWFPASVLVRLDIEPQEGTVRTVGRVLSPCLALPHLPAGSDGEMPSPPAV